MGPQDRHRRGLSAHGGRISKRSACYRDGSVLEFLRQSGIEPSRAEGLYPGDWEELWAKPGSYGTRGRLAVASISSDLAGGNFNGVSVTFPRRAEESYSTPLTHSSEPSGRRQRARSSFDHPDTRMRNGCGRSGRAPSRSEVHDQLELRRMLRSADPPASCPSVSGPRSRPHGANSPKHLRCN